MQIVQLADELFLLRVVPEQFDVNEVLLRTFQIAAFLVARGQKDVAGEHRNGRDDLRAVVQTRFVEQRQIGRDTASGEVFRDFFFRAGLQIGESPGAVRCLFDEGHGLSNRNPEMP